ncbi:MAG: TonB-dependent siderophore receptor [Sphingomonas sp.]|nr:TonB-dependent siderophore receptor [Sphingomonas sp.]
MVVTGERPEYGVRSTLTATRTKTDIRDIPQALTVISERQIEDQALRSFNELLLFVPGATPATGEGNRDQFTIRGNNTTADFFIDGIRDDVAYYRDFYNADRVEVLKGPNAMIFGRGGGGGVINRVLKRASLGSYRGFLVSGDSHGGRRVTGDIDQPLGSAVGLRVNGVYENSDSFRRNVELERYAINPTLAFVAGPSTRIDVGFEHLRDERTTDRGVPSLNGKPLQGFDRTFFGDPDDSRNRAEVSIANLGLQHDFGGGLTLRNRSLYGDYDKFYQNIYPGGPLNTSGANAGTVALSAYNDVTRRKNLFSQTDLIWEGQLGGIDQTLLVGFEVGRQRGQNQRRNGVFGGSEFGSGGSSIFVPIDSVTLDVPVAFTGGGANNGIKGSVAAAYVQDQIRLTDRLEAVAGLRFDRFAIDIANRNTGETFERNDQMWSPRLGLIFKPMQNLSLYTSYSRSYLPQSGDQFNSLSLTTEALKPERFDNYEAGLKWEPIEGLLATAAIYQLDRANTQAKDANDLTVLTGSQRSRGLELGLERSISDRWQISAGYALQKAKITETTTAAPEGREVPLVPRHSLSAWTRYDVTKSLGVGLGAVARSKSYASLSNQVTLPGYARVDAALFFKLARGVEAQINVENLFGADYFPAAHNDNNIAPGAPRTAKATVKFGF